MIKYSLLYKDEKTQISYFYNLDDNSVYTNNKPLNNNLIKELSAFGSFVAILIYCFIRFIKLPSISISWIITVLIGILTGWIISLFIIKNSRLFFIPENKQEITSEEIKKMYLAGISFRKKYNKLLFGFLIFTILSTMFFYNTRTNLFLFISLIYLWSIISIMFFTNRPICSYKLKKICK